LNRKKLKKTILVLILLSVFVTPAFARRVETSPAVGKDYYIALRNILAKYILFPQACNFMDGFSANLQIFDRRSKLIQDVCRAIRKTIFKIENSRESVLLISYFIKSILPQFQSELYHYNNPQIYEEVLNTIVDDLGRLDRTRSEKPETVFYKIISENSSRQDDVGAFFAQMFKNLYVNGSNFEQEYSKLQRIVSGENYKTHTKLQILRDAVNRIMSDSEKIVTSSPEINLLIEGSLQKDIFIKAYSISTLASLCSLDGLSADIRLYIFNSARNGVKSIHWDIYFDRNGEIPEEVNYLAVLIDYLAEAEEFCREFGLDIDLARDEQFVKIYELLLFKGFDFEKAEYLFNKN